LLWAGNPTAANGGGETRGLERRCKSPSGERGGNVKTLGKKRFVRGKVNSTSPKKCWIKWGRIRETNNRRRMIDD